MHFCWYLPDNFFVCIIKINYGLLGLTIEKNNVLPGSRSAGANTFALIETMF